MPLDPEDEPWPGSSIASIVPSGAQARGPQALAERVDRLVVEGVDLERRVHRASLAQPALGGGLDAWVAMLPCSGWRC